MTFSPTVLQSITNLHSKLSISHTKRVISWGSWNYVDAPKNCHDLLNLADSKMAKINWINISIIVFSLVWCSLFISVFLPEATVKNNETFSEEATVDTLTVDTLEDGKDAVARIEVESEMLEPKRFHLTEAHHEPAPLEEIRANMTLYLHTLHAKFVSMAGPTVDAESVWEAYLDITKSMPMAWDDQNKHRIPVAKTDGSIFVSLGTYRDPYCPMTLKSLYAQAKNPEKLYVSLLQQNCFLATCRTGVLVGGKVDDMGPDVDCYKEFCKSPEGQRSGACLTDQIRLFNVNESESLGPYMARYLGAKFYR